MDERKLKLVDWYQSGTHGQMSPSKIVSSTILRLRTYFNMEFS